MVVALREVKIRGEIRTIVDYAMEMIQSPDFVGNNIHTGWLDSRIASQVRTLDQNRWTSVMSWTSIDIFSCIFGSMRWCDKQNWQIKFVCTASVCPLAKTCGVISKLQDA